MSPLRLRPLRVRPAHVRPPGASARGIVSLAGALLLPAAGAAQEDVRALSPVRVAAQVTTGIVAGPAGFFGVGVLTKRAAERLGASDERASQLAYVGGWTGAAIATAAAPAAIGARGPGRGSFSAALGGAAAGGLASWALVTANRRAADEPDRPCRLVCAIASVAVFTLPSIGATVAYDLTRKPVR